MKSNLLIHPYAKHLAPGFFGLVCGVLIFGGQASYAQDIYTTSVTVLDYYGQQGTDYEGRPVYGAKVEQGGDFYFVELHDPIPSLASQRNEKLLVTVNRKTKFWGKVYFNGQVASIHKVTRDTEDTGEKKPGHTPAQTPHFDWR